MAISQEALALLEQLDPYLLRIAHKLHCTTWPQADPDDLLQEMRLWFLEKYGDARDLGGNAPGYYSRGAAWAARHWARDFFTRYHRGQRIAWADPLPEWVQDRGL